MKARLLVVFLLSLALVLSGCPKAPPAPTPVKAPPVATPSPAVIITPTPPPTPAAVAKPTGELRIAVATFEGETMDPSLGPETLRLFIPLYDYLVGGTARGELSRETGLARDWEVSHGPKSSTYTIYVRPGVRFHNGEEVTAADVKFTIEYFMRPKSVSSRVSLFRRVVDRVEAPERYKVVIHTKERYGMLLYDLSPLGAAEGMVVPKKYIEGQGEEKFNLNPIGTGFYKFKEHVVGSYIKYEAVENHWLYGTPRWKTITFILAPEESTRIAILKTGQADIIDVSREQIGPLKAAGFNGFVKPESDVVMLWLGNQWQEDTYLYDKRVREALNLAVNRKEILDFIFQGQGKLSGDSGFYGSWAVGYEPQPLYPFDPERAKALLKEAFPGGVELTLHSYPRPGVPELPRMMEAISAMWGKVGIKTKIVPMDYVTHRTRQARGAIPNTVAPFVGANRPMGWVGAWGILYHSKALLTLTKRADLDALIEAADAETEIDRHVMRQNEGVRFMRENHLTVPLLETGAVYFVNPKKVAEWDLGKMKYELNLPNLVRWR